MGGGRWGEGGGGRGRGGARGRRLGQESEGFDFWTGGEQVTIDGTCVNVYPICTCVHTIRVSIGI